MCIHNIAPEVALDGTQHQEWQLGPNISTSGRQLISHYTLSSLSTAALKGSHLPGAITALLRVEGQC